MRFRYAAARTINFDSAPAAAPTAHTPITHFPPYIVIAPIIREDEKLSKESELRLTGKGERIDGVWSSPVGATTGSGIIRASKNTRLIVRWR